MTIVKRGVVRDKESSRVAVFLALLKQRGLPHPHREYRFHDTRKWRFDYAWPEHSLAVEQQGGVWMRGRHSRGAGQVKDFEKLNTAQLMGWRVLQVTPQQLCTEETMDMIEQLVRAA